MNVWQRLRPALVRLGGGGLALRFVALSLVLLLAVQAAGLAVVDRSIDRQARNQLDGELRVGERVWLRLLDTQAQRLRQGAALLSSDYGFRTAAASGDAETIASALRNHGARIGASVAGLLDTEFAPRALHTGGAAMAPQAVHDIVEALVRDGSASRIALVDGHPHQFVAVPMRAPLTIGWVVMGFPLGDAVVQDMHALSGLHVTLLAVPDGGPARLAGTTLDAAAAEALRQRGSGFEGALDLAGQAAYGHAMQQDVAGGALHAVLLRSIDEVAAPLHELQRVLAMLTLVGVLLFGLGSAWMARRLTTPLRALARASEELGRGDPALPTRGSERRDEIGDLARAFDQMRRDVARHQAELHELAFTDRLTGIRNRTGFHAALAQALAVAAPHRVPVGVLMLGLDRFRLVNDVLGHATGDALLRAVATRLLGDVLRHGDVVARLGGDEFALLLPGSDADATRAVAQRIARSFAQPLTLDTQAVDLSAAVGIACWPAHGGGADELLMHAEVAMYAAKRRREPALVYTPAMDPGSAATLSLLSQLRRAVEHGELRMLLQPKVALAGHRLVGAEALMRWSHPERGMVPPAEFIPFAEQTGFVRELTLWMVEEAARHWQALQGHGPLTVSINLSVRDLMDPALPAKLDERLARHGAPARGFCLEITESAVMDDPERAKATLDALSARGFTLSIDDFGTGYASLAYLHRLPVDELKIDRSFIVGLLHGADDAKIVRSTIELAHTLGLEVVAEGIETQAVYERLAEMGCDVGQGYHLSRPLQPSAFGDWAQHWRARAVQTAPALSGAGD